MSKWIKCSDQMPEPRTLCIVCGKYPFATQYSVFVAEYWWGADDKKENEEWCNVCYEQNDWLNVDCVTHWMPMPEMP